MEMLGCKSWRTAPLLVFLPQREGRGEEGVSIVCGLPVAVREGGGGGGINKTKCRNGK